MGIDRHYNWQKEKSLKFDSKKFQCQNLQLAYDSIGGRIFMVLKEKVLVYHVDNKQVDTLSVEKENLILEYPDRLFILLLLTS